MSIPIVKNFKTVIYKYILGNRTNYRSVDPALLYDLNLKKLSLEKVPVTDIFQKQDYSFILSKLKNDNHKRKIAKHFLDENSMNNETYATLSMEELQAIRAQLTPGLVDDAESIVSVSKIIKKIFDEIYGEGKYTFVSIGRSLSSVAKCLEFMGVESKQIPLSGCGSIERDVINETVAIMIRQAGFKEYKNFLEKNLQNADNKKYIICDYASTGTTLEVFKNLLNHREIRVNSKNFIYVGINELLDKFATFDYKKFPDTIIKFDYKLFRQSFDKYSEVKFLHYGDLKNINLSLEPKNSRLNKLMKFCMLDMLKLFKSKE